MRIGFWRYQLILVILYTLWGNLLAMDSLAAQLVLDFALFYPVGLLGGYFPQKDGEKEAYLSALTFNIMTYLVASLAGAPLGVWWRTVIDFSAVVLAVWLGLKMGRRARPQK